MPGPLLVNDKINALRGFATREIAERKAVELLGNRELRYLVMSSSNQRFVVVVIINQNAEWNSLIFNTSRSFLFVN